MYYGNKRRVGRWENDKDIGVWIYYDINGKVNSTQNY
jgi:hypothetical protein